MKNNVKNWLQFNESYDKCCKECGEEECVCPCEKCEKHPCKCEKIEEKKKEAKSKEPKEGKEKKKVGLTAAQKKLPPALQAAILKKQK